jgi:hypothetical protein
MNNLKKQFFFVVFYFLVSYHVSFQLLIIEIYRQYELIYKDIYSYYLFNLFLLYLIKILHLINLYF